ncbi:MAG: transposase [Thioalkalivibrio sp.]|nr:MAG: transposase [Thioalkalivibrio sp.]
MPRKPRFTLPGVPQHVIQRGNNREPCFLAEQDYRRYLEDLAAAAEKSDCRVHAYVLMTNHVHLLVTPMQEHGIAEMMQALGRRYVQYINKRYRRTGTLWEGRYKASLVDSEAYLLTCMRYIELNPLRAGMVEHAGEYQWSSYGANAQGRPDPLLSPHPLYTALGSVPADRQHAYRELFRDHMAEAQLHEIRDALDHELVLGRSSFKDRIEAMTQRQTRLGVPGRPRVGEACGTYYIDG